jgi:hypothetical protein
MSRGSHPPIVTSALVTGSDTQFSQPYDHGTRWRAPRTVSEVESFASLQDALANRAAMDTAVSSRLLIPIQGFNSLLVAVSQAIPDLGEDGALLDVTNWSARVYLVGGRSDAALSDLSNFFVVPAHSFSSQGNRSTAERIFVTGFLYASVIVESLTGGGSLRIFTRAM